MRHPTDKPEGALPWPKVKILVFSQDDGFRFMVRSTFRKLMVRDVLSTGVADDAEHMLSHAPDVALVDFDHDPQAALGFIARLKAAPRNPNPNMPILVAVKAADRHALDPALNMGVEGVVPKPVSGHELSLRVAETLRHPHKAAAPAPVLPKPAPARVAPQPRPAAAPATRPGPGFVSNGGGMVEAPPAAAKPPSAPIEVVETAPPPARKPATPIEVLAAKAPAQYQLETRAEDEAARKAAEKRRKAWQEAIEQSGHKPHKGADVASLDVTAFVADHLEWLGSQGAAGTRANMQGRDLAGADLTHAVLANATFREADLSDAVMVECRLDGADFRYATLDAANLAGANLGVAQLRHAKARLSNLEGVVLRGADLSGADLRGARMAGADVKGAMMISTDLRGTDLSQVENLAQSQLDKAVCDMKTKLPPGLTRPAKD